MAQSQITTGGIEERNDLNLALRKLPIINRGMFGRASYHPLPRVREAAARPAAVGAEAVGAEAREEKARQHRSCFR